MIEKRRSHRLAEIQKKFCMLPEPVVLTALLVIAAMSWSFFELADYVLEGKTQPLDDWVVNALRNPAQPRMPRGPTWLAESARDITSLGSMAVLTLTTAAAAGFLFLRGQWKAMALMLLAVATAAILSGLLKHFISRERPPFGSDLVNVVTYSFPSGHSMLSAIVYLVLGSMLARAESHRGVKLYFLILAILLTMLVGMSRVYLGVHYPSDVLGGWTAGLAWALLWWIIARYLGQRGAVEPSSR